MIVYIKRISRYSVPTGNRGHWAVASHGYTRTLQRYLLIKIFHYNYSLQKSRKSKELFYSIKNACLSITLIISDTLDKNVSRVVVHKVERNKVTMSHYI